MTNNPPVDAYGTALLALITVEIGIYAIGVSPTMPPVGYMTIGVLLTVYAMVVTGELAVQA